MGMRSEQSQDVVTSANGEWCPLEEKEVGFCATARLACWVYRARPARSGFGAGAGGPGKPVLARASRPKFPRSSG